jgi:bacteriocin-like protein
MTNLNNNDRELTTDELNNVTGGEGTTPFYGMQFSINQSRTLAGIDGALTALAGAVGSVVKTVTGPFTH